MSKISLAPSIELARVVPQMGVINAEAPIPIIMIDSPSREMAEQVSSLIMSVQNGRRTLTGAPVYYGDNNLAVDVLVGKERVLVQVYPRRPAGHLTYQFVWSGWSDRMGWDLFSIYFNRSRQYTLAPSVNQLLPREFPSLVKHDLQTVTITSGR